MAATTTRPKMSPRRRSELIRYVLYGVLVVAAFAAIFFADWGRIQRNFFNTESMREMLPDVITIAARNTVIYTVASFSLGIVGALVLALMKMSSIKPYKWIATVYIELFRGLPALITIILVAFGLPIAFGWRIPGGTLGTGSLGLAIVAAAYMAETIRAGVEAVPRGQMEAARSLGMSRARAMASIVLPQAFRIIVPPLTNEFVLLIKDTSLLFVIGTTPLTKELTKFARDFMTTERNATPLTVAAILYLIITLPLTRLVAQLEKRTARAR